MLHLDGMVAALIGWKVAHGFRWWPDRLNRRMHLNLSLVPLSIEWKDALEWLGGSFDWMEGCPRIPLVAGSTE
jgi:hypothetical protein